LIVHGDRVPLWLTCRTQYLCESTSPGLHFLKIQSVPPLLQTAAYSMLSHRHIVLFH
jgi:hypothetical protein